MRIARKLLPQGIMPKPLNKNKGPVLTILSNQSQLHPTSIGSIEESAFCKKGTSSVSCEACTSNVIRLAQVESLSNKKWTSIRSTIPIYCTCSFRNLKHRSSEMFQYAGWCSGHENAAGLMLLSTNGS